MSNSYLESALDLAGKTILVTGASSGIGRRVAMDLAASGARLIISGRNQARLDETMQTLAGEGHSSVVCDMALEDQINRLAQALPPLDGLVHCAGVLNICPVSHTDSEDAEYQHRVNHHSAVMLAQKLIRGRLLKQGASLVFVSSVSAVKPSIGFGVYASSKAALEAFARVLALEVASLGVRVNCVAPGMVRTPMFDQAVDMVSEEAMAEHEKLYPLGFATPEDVSPSILFLLSAASSKITGITLTIDGGYSL